MSENQIVRRVKVDRTRSPQKALGVTGRWRFLNSEVVTMPRGEGNEVEVVFFSPEPWEYTHPNYMSDDDFEKALVRRGLTNDPFAVFKANEDDPTIANTHPHGVHWKDADGNWCCAAFNRWDGWRDVLVRRRGHIGWSYGYWFAGSRKVSS